MSDDASHTSGASPVSGNACHSVPYRVLFDVMWTYAAPGVSAISDDTGSRRKPSPSVEAAIRAAPIFLASASARCAQPPVTR